MNTLPPLRTFRTAAPVPVPQAAERACHPVLAQAKLPPVARELLQELFDLQLVDPEPVAAFLTSHAAKLAALVTRERVGNVLAAAGVITRYQRDRVVAGSTFGLVLGAYRVLERINGGSVGVVFLGEHVLLKRKVALKVLPIEEGVRPDLLDRFRAEMRMLAALDHPNVVTAYDAGWLESPGLNQPALHYLVLEHMSGGDLEQYVYDHGPRPVAAACEWGRQAASGLQAVHDRLFVHRDVKPSNLLVTADGRVKLVDFGLARQLTTAITRPGMLLGSVEFMAPEQGLDPALVGSPADIYGLGTTLFWMMTGQLPIPRERTVAESLKAIQTGKPRRLRELEPTIPEPIDELVHAMLSRDPARRPSATEVIAALIPYAEAPSPAGELPVPSGEPTRLRALVRQLQESLQASDVHALGAEDALLSSLARIADLHSGIEPGNSNRAAEYTRLLGLELSCREDWPILQNSSLLSEVVRCVPIRDIGMIGLRAEGTPDASTDVGRGKLERHTLLGSEMIEALARDHGDTLTFLPVARSVVRSHHERWDGTGYPDGLAGDKIPAVARIVALADAYDVYRTSDAFLTHAEAIEAILADPGRFDPTVLDAFRACADKFEEYYPDEAEVIEIEPRHTHR